MNKKSMNKVSDKLKNNPTMDDDYLFAASASDCTGLIPSSVHDLAEAESYDEIVHYRPSAVKKKKD